MTRVKKNISSVCLVNSNKTICYDKCPLFPSSNFNCNKHNINFNCNKHNIKSIWKHLFQVNKIMKYSALSSRGQEKAYIDWLYSFGLVIYKSIPGPIGKKVYILSNSESTTQLLLQCFTFRKVINDNDTSNAYVTRLLCSFLKL